MRKHWPQALAALRATIPQNEVIVRALRRLTKTAVACALCALGVVFAAGATDAATKKEGFTTKAQNAILLDSGADLVLYEKNADTRIPPASMSKLMTLAVVFRELKAGRIKLDDTFKVSEHAWRTGGAPSRPPPCSRRLATRSPWKI